MGLKKWVGELGQGKGGWCVGSDGRVERGWC